MSSLLKWVFFVYQLRFWDELVRDVRWNQVHVIKVFSDFVMWLDISHYKVLGSLTRRFGSRLWSLWNTLIRRATHHTKHEGKEEVSFTSLRVGVSLKDKDLLSLVGWTVALIILSKLSTIDSWSTFTSLLRFGCCDDFHGILSECHIVVITYITIKLDFSMNHFFLFLFVKESLVDLLYQFHFEFI